MRRFTLGIAVAGVAVILAEAYVIRSMIESAAEARQTIAQLEQAVSARDTALREIRRQNEAARTFSELRDAVRDGGFTDGLPTGVLDVLDRLGVRRAPDPDTAGTAGGSDGTTPTD